MRYRLPAAAVLTIGALAHAQSPQPTQVAAAPAGTTTCQSTVGGIEYRAYYPDRHRFVYISATTLRGVQPSILFIIDKNYDSPEEAPAVDPAVTAWWINRSRPFSFSTNKIKTTYDTRFSFEDLFSHVFGSTPPKEVTVTILGLTKRNGHFEGTGNTNTNAYAFELRVDLPLTTGESFDVTLPTVTYDGVTVTPPVLHFQRSDDDQLESTVKC